MKVNTPIATILTTARAPPSRQGAAPRQPGRRLPKSAPPRRQGRGRARRRSARRPRRRRRRARSGSPCGHRDGRRDHPRGAARRNGRGDAPRPRRVPDGRRGRGISGRLQGHAGAAAGVRRAARDRYADHRARLCRHRRRRGDGGPEADRRVHDLQFRHAGDRPDHQLRRQDAVHVRRPDGLLDRVPRSERRRRPRRRPAQPGLFGLVLAGPGPEGGRAVFGRRRQGPVESGDPRSQPGDLPRKRDAVRPFRPGAEAGRLCDPDRQGADRARRQGRHASSRGRTA